MKSGKKGKKDEMVPSCFRRYSITVFFAPGLMPGMRLAVQAYGFTLENQVELSLE
jgi:hypothetical protein